jgi:SPP1 gp7 family putative phage head morphogenesis protein
MGLIAVVDFWADFLRLPVNKALDPNSKRDFLLISRRFQNAVRGLTQAAEAEALKSAIDTLDVDWSSLSDAQKDRVVEAAKGALSKPAASVASKIEETFTVFGKKVAGDTKKAADKQYGFSIETSLTANDHKVIEAVSASQGNFVRDQYGRLSEDLSETAKDVVSSGLEQGLGSADISANIQDALGEQAKARSDAYWNMIAMTFANRARTYGNLSGYAAAGIETFRFEAVMDERTSEVCEMMHGRQFQVSRAIDRYESVEADDDPESITEKQPWLNVGTDSNGKRQIYFGSGDDRTHVAHVNEGGSGGRFSNAMSNRALEAAGITTPPLHGNCRSTIVPED